MPTKTTSCQPADAPARPPIGLHRSLLICLFLGLGLQLAVGFKIMRHEQPEVVLLGTLMAASAAVLIVAGLMFKLLAREEASCCAELTQHNRGDQL